MDIRTLSRLVLLAGFLAFITQLLGFASPAWLVITSATLSTDIHYAIWYQRICYSDQCTVYTYHEKAPDSLFFNYDKTAGLSMEQLVEFEVETTLALVLCGVALLLCRRFVKILRGAMEPSKDRTSLMAATAFMLLSGIAVLIAVGKAGQQNRLTSSVLRHQGVDATVGLPYSLILSGVGGGLAVICGFLLIYSIVKGGATGQPEQPLVLPRDMQGTALPCCFDGVEQSGVFVIDRNQSQPPPYCEEPPPYQEKAP